MGKSTSHLAVPTVRDEERPGLWLLTTKVDHNGTRREPIPADASMAQTQVSDGGRQSGRILQTEAL